MRTLSAYPFLLTQPASLSINCKDSRCRGEKGFSPHTRLGILLVEARHITLEIIQTPQWPKGFDALAKRLPFAFFVLAQNEKIKK